MISFRKDNLKKLLNPHQGQFQYLGRWVNKENFRAFLYNEKGDQKLANSYNDYESLIASGIWFASKPSASQQKRKQKDVICPNG
jgi:hypothetical protein